MFSETMDILFRQVRLCEDGIVKEIPPFYPRLNFTSCDEYWDDQADVMRIKSFRTAGWWGMVFAICIIGNVLTFYGFGMASERLSKRVRDASFAALLRQEVGFFGTLSFEQRVLFLFLRGNLWLLFFVVVTDKQSVGKITSQLQDDAARIHAFSGEPVRAFLTAVSSVVIGIALGFYVRASLFCFGRRFAS
jgi:ATP-binding cassette, subfamily B (MDR/TAP), member 1